MTIAIRELGVGDEAALHELMDAVSPGWDDRFEPKAGGAAAFLADEATTVLGAYDGSEPVGWAWFVRIRRPNGWWMTYLHQLDVVESHRRQGIATRLVQRSMATAKRGGSHQLWLSTGSHNDIAQAVYERLEGVRKPQGDVNYWWDLT